MNPMNYSQVMIIYLTQLLHYTNYLCVCSTITVFSFFIRKFLDDEQKKEIKCDALILNPFETACASTSM